jgi:hypothetical protein
MLSLAGCGLLGRQSATLVPLKDDPSIVFPPFTDRVPVQLGAPGVISDMDGELLRALMVATRDFLPPASEELPCALKQEAQVYRILREGDVFFISIAQDPVRCGYTSPALDSGVRYAISREGRILRRRLDGQPEFPPETPKDADGSWTPAAPGVASPLDAPAMERSTPPLLGTDAGFGPDAG